MEEREFMCVECGLVFKYKPIFFCGREIKLKYCENCVNFLSQQAEKQNNNATCLGLYGSANLPKAYASSKMEGLFKEYPHQTEAMSFDINNKKFPYLYGPPGTGKTFIATKLAYDFIEEFMMPVLFTTTQELKDIKFDRKKDFRDVLVGNELIILDDAGSSFINQMTVEILKEVMDNRLFNKKPIIITSNYDPVQLGKSLKDRLDSDSSNVICDSITDRVLELCVPIKVKGDSVRREMFVKEFQRNDPGKRKNKG